MTTTAPAQRPAGQLLRHWREHRRLSQLEFSIRADVSTRHLSFVETGRSQPSRDMLLHLAGELDLALRDRNQLLLAAGYAPVYSERALEAPEMAAVRTAVGQILAGHEPYPAVVVDRGWNLVDGNSSVAMFTAGAADHLLAPPMNVLRLALHPDGMAGRIVNLGEFRAHLLGRLRRQVDLSGNAELQALYDELAGYPGGDPDPPAAPAPAAELVALVRIQHGDAELSFFSTVATFGTPLDITVAELMIESFFPADAATAAVLRG